MEKFKTSDNFEIGFSSLPSGINQDVLFIHGNLASSLWWEPSIEKLKGPGPNKLVTADWRGYGESLGLAADAKIDFERYATDYIELAESLEMKDINVIGHSTGGLIAMMAILQRPELFKSLTLLDSVGATGLELQLPKDQVLAHFEKMSVDKDYCTLVLAATIEGVNPGSESFTRLADQTFTADKVNWAGVPGTLADEVDITARMPELNLPTLILIST